MNKLKTNVWFYISVLVIIALFPNIFVLFFGKKLSIGVFCLALSLLFFPLIFLKVRYWLWYLFLLVLLSPFEIITLFTTKSRINNVIIASVFSTDKKEAGELFLSIIPIVVLCVLMIVFFLYIKQKIKYLGYLSTRNRLYIAGFVFFSFVISGIFERQNVSSNVVSIQTVKDLKNKLSYEVYPTDLIYNSAIYFREVRKEKKIGEQLENFRFGAVKNDSIPQIVLYVIGESSRAANWSLFGYDRKTNPLLEKQENLHLFSNTLSCANSTFISLPMLLSRSTPQQPKHWYKEGNLMQLFKESGYHTAWLGGQSGGHVMVKLSAKSATTVDLGDTMDNILIEKAKKIISQTKGSVFIVIHLQGSHYDYKERYPENFEIFKPTSSISATEKDKKGIINAYDNSVLFTDYNLNDLMSLLESDQRPSVLYYTADHGENLMDDERNLTLHVQETPTQFELHVPTLVWTSDSYANIYPEKIKSLEKNRQKRMSNTVSFESVSDLGNIRYKNQDLKNSISSEKFEEFKKRFYLSQLKSSIQYD